LENTVAHVGAQHPGTRVENFHRSEFVVGSTAVSRRKINYGEWCRSSETKKEIIRNLREADERLERHESVRFVKVGKTVAVSPSMSQLRNSTGKLMDSSNIAHEIIDRQLAEQLLRESEGRFRLLADEAPVMTWMSGTDKLSIFLNQGWLNFTGRSLEQELGEGWVSGVHPDDRKYCLGTFSAAFDARAEFEMEYRLRRFDGTYRWVVDYGIPRFESNGTFCGYISRCVDITDRKLSEESLHNLSGLLIKAQEEERVRIARELHDDFCQRLALLSIGLEQLYKRIPVSNVEERAMIEEVLKGMEELSTDLHSLSHQLHSSKLDLVGLVPALCSLCKELGEKYEIKLQFTKQGFPIEIPKEVALCLFRVAQEALGNVVKHSGAKSAQVALGANGNDVSLRISDKGRGFDTALMNQDGGIGLRGMSERLRIVGGRFRVISQLSEGTEILVEVPLATSGENTKVKSHYAGK
jgi:PAS domain S-box-containing protein